MGLFGRSKERSKGAEPSGEAACKHADLTPMWDSVADLGQRDKVTRYKCARCQRIFGVDEGRAMLAAAATSAGAHP